MYGIFDPWYLRDDYKVKKVHAHSPPLSKNKVGLKNKVEGQKNDVPPNKSQLNSTQLTDQPIKYSHNQPTNQPTNQPIKCLI